MDTAVLPLPRWEVALHGDERDLEHLAKHFNREDWRIYEDVVTGQTVMMVDGFSLEANHADVLAFAAARVTVLSGVLKMAGQASRMLTVGSVEQRQVDGSRHAYLPMCGTLLVGGEMSAKAFKRGDGGEWVPLAAPEPLTVRWATLAMADPIVAKAMRLVCAADAGTPVGLYRLCEVIESDVGSVVTAGWTTKNQQERFRRSVNSPEISGDVARHGSNTHAPPPNPMDPCQSKAHVQMLLDAWLAKKLAA